MRDYDKKKLELGLDVVNIKLPEDNISDEVFTKLHPNIQAKLTQILQSKKPLNELKKMILEDDGRRRRNLSESSRMFSNYASPAKNKSKANQL